MTPSCTECGACCVSDSPRHVSVTGDDYERLGDEAEELVTFLGNRAFLRIVPADFGALALPSRCALLAYDGQQFACTRYERRPETCRALERGSPACEAERERKAARLAHLRGAMTLGAERSMR